MTSERRRSSFPIPAVLRRTVVMTAAMVAIGLPAEERASHAARACDAVVALEAAGCLEPCIPKSSDCERGYFACVIERGIRVARTEGCGAASIGRLRQYCAEKRAAECHARHSMTLEWVIRRAGYDPAKAADVMHQGGAIVASFLPNPLWIEDPRGIFEPVGAGHLPPPPDPPESPGRLVVWPEITIEPQQAIVTSPLDWLRIPDGVSLSLVVGALGADLQGVRMELKQGAEEDSSESVLSFQFDGGGENEPTDLRAGDERSVRILARRPDGREVHARFVTRAGQELGSVSLHPPTPSSWWNLTIIVIGVVLGSTITRGEAFLMAAKDRQRIRQLRRRARRLSDESGLREIEDDLDLARLSLSLNPGQEVKTLTAIQRKVGKLEKDGLGAQRRAALLSLKDSLCHVVCALRRKQAAAEARYEAAQASLSRTQGGVEGKDEPVPAGEKGVVCRISQWLLPGRVVVWFRRWHANRRRRSDRRARETLGVAASALQVLCTSIPSKGAPSADQAATAIAALKEVRGGPAFGLKLRRAQNPCRGASAEARIRSYARALLRIRSTVGRWLLANWIMLVGAALVTAATYLAADATPVSPLGQDGVRLFMAAALAGGAAAASVSAVVSSLRGKK